MSPDALAAKVSVLLRDQLGLPVLEWEATEAGMNSTTVLLKSADTALIAKWVGRAGISALRRGAQAAADLAVVGVRSGPPMRWRNGALSIPLGEGEVVVLEKVDGAPLTAEETDQDAWGSNLAAIHAASRRPAGPIDDFFAAVGLSAEPMSPEPWIDAALVSTTSAVRSMPELSWVQLHTDPAPEAFLRDAAGVVGVVDWTGSVPGPALYDVASAVMYAGGEAKAARLLHSYSRTIGSAGVVNRDDLREFARLRAVVQAVYFSHRLSSRDLTGVASQRDNETGLEDARRMLDDLAVLRDERVG